MGDAILKFYSEGDRISDLPLLLTNGYPISLEKVTSEQLELFIHFLLKRSLKLPYIDEKYAAPKWWPKNLEFKNPFKMYPLDFYF